MEQLIQQIVARCQVLVAGALYDDPTSSTGGKVQIPVHAHFLPVPTSPEDKEAQAPYLVVRLVGLEEHDGKINPMVRIFGAVFTHGSVAEGMAAMLDVTDRLRPLVKRGPGQIPGYKLLPPIMWQFGDKEDGGQVHPFYQFQADLRFSGV